MAQMPAPAGGGPGGRVRVRRRYGLPWQVVFRAWVEPARLAAWFGPQGHTVPEYRAEVVPGGSYRLTLRAPDQSEHTVSGTYLAVEPPGRLAFTWVEEREGREASESVVEVRLSPERGGTLLVLEHGPLATTELLESHRRAWRSTLDSLALALAEDPP